MKVEMGTHTDKNRGVLHMCAVGVALFSMAGRLTAPRTMASTSAEAPARMRWFMWTLRVRIAGAVAPRSRAMRMGD